jgi:uncharacterized protein YdaU (DUF1376 family)
MSKRKGPLSKVDKFYIDNNSGLTSEELASDLDRSVSTISKHRKTRTKHLASIKEDTKSSVVGDLMGNKTASQKRKGVTIMTPAASELSDEKKSTPLSKNSDSVVHRIKK